MLVLPGVPTPLYIAEPLMFIPAIVPDVAAPTALMSAVDADAVLLFD